MLPGSSPLPCGTFPMRSMLTWIQRHELLLLGGVALVAFVLGMVGVRWQGGDGVGWGDAVYFALRLFAFDFDLGGEGGRPYAPANPALQVARFLAPATVACAVIKAFMLATARQLTLWRIARWKHHEKGASHQIWASCQIPQFWWLAPFFPFFFFRHSHVCRRETFPSVPSRL